MIFFGIKNTVFLLIRMEFLRFFREPSRLIAMIVQPLLFLAVFGAGFQQNFVIEGRPEISYIAFFFPGILAMVVLFCSIYSTLTLVEDKATGFFSYVMQGPGGIFGAILGKSAATTILAFLQAMLFLPLMLFLPIELGRVNFSLLLLALLIGSIAFSLAGVMLAWFSKTVSVFHAVMSIILLPSWLLSGAMFPLDGNRFFWFLKLVNPMCFFVSILRSCIIDYGFDTQKDWILISIFLVVLIVSFFIIFMEEKRVYAR